MGEIYVNQEHEEEAYEKWAVDDTRGKDLDVESVTEARPKEVTIMVVWGGRVQPVRRGLGNASTKAPCGTSGSA